MISVVYAVPFLYRRYAVSVSLSCHVRVTTDFQIELPSAFVPLSQLVLPTARLAGILGTLSVGTGVFVAGEAVLVGLGVLVAFGADGGCGVGLAAAVVGASVELAAVSP